MAAMLRVNEVNRERMGSAAGVAAIHALLGYLLLTGLGFELPLPGKEELKLITFADDPPPPPSQPPPPEKVEETTEAKPRDAEGAASPPNLKDTPTQIVAPPPKLVVPTPIPAAPIAGQGNAPEAGAAEIPGPGTGRGGVGIGLGSGTQGTGTGGGGAGIGRARTARLLSGGIGPRDIPPWLSETREVHMNFTVMPNGRIRGCTVTRSSGMRELDALTCRLLERRLRYRPALDGEGRLTSQHIVGSVQVWGIHPDARPAVVEEEEGES